MGNTDHPEHGSRLHLVEPWALDAERAVRRDGLERLEQMEEKYADQLSQDPHLQERWLAFKTAMKTRHEMAQQHCTQLVEASNILDQANTAYMVALTYVEAGEMLRHATQTMREDQHCELCGFQFNYENGTLMKSPDWCDVRQRKCNMSRHHPFCIANQEAERQANRRARQTAKDVTARRPPRPRARTHNPVPTNGHRPTQ